MRVFSRCFIVSCLMFVSSPAWSDETGTPHVWAGSYFGITAGGSGNLGSTDYNQAPGDVLGVGAPFAATGFQRSDDDRERGFIGGLLIGYNFQQNGLLWGIESDIKGTTLDTNYAETFSRFGDILQFGSKLDWVGSLRGRLGLAQGSWLIYGTAGLAYGRVQSDLSQRVVFPPNNVGSRSVSQSDLQAGWVVGGGIEYALSSKLTFGLQYLYTDLEDTNISFGTQVINGPIYAPASVNFENNSQEISARLTVKLYE